MVAAHRSHHDILSLVLKGARLTFVNQPAFGNKAKICSFLPHFSLCLQQNDVKKTKNSKHYIYFYQKK